MNITPKVLKGLGANKLCDYYILEVRGEDFLIQPRTIKNSNAWIVNTEFVITDLEERLDIIAGRFQFFGQGLPFVIR